MKSKLCILLAALILSGCSIKIDFGVDDDAENETTTTSQITTATEKPVETTETTTLAKKIVDTTTTTKTEYTQNYSFTYVEASSQLDDQYGYNYSPYNLIDGNTQTAWVEGVEGTGEGEWVELYSDSMQTIHRIGICNGYRLNNDIYSKNGKVRSATLIFTDGSTRTMNFDSVDSEGFTYIDLGEINTNYIGIYLDSCVRGNKYDDTCISEIRIY